MRKLFSRLFKNDSGSNALEYGLIVGLISVAIVGGATVAGASLGGLFDSIGTTISGITLA
jgi:pilus assembly protein Flp/PilA